MSMKTCADELALKRFIRRARWIQNWSNLKVHQIEINNVAVRLTKGAPVLVNPRIPV
jgi:hypothetical protein